MKGYLVEVSYWYHYELRLWISVPLKGSLLATVSTFFLRETTRFMTTGFCDQMFGVRVPYSQPIFKPLNKKRVRDEILKIFS